MAEVLLRDLVDGWETMLLAAWYPDDQVQSKLRQNKQLAALQRVGIPIPIKFNNIRKGPASLDVKPRAEKAEGEGFLEYHESPTSPSQHDREEWHLRPDGREYVQTTLMEALDEHPRGELYLDVFHNEMRRIGFAKNPELVQEAHDILYLDDDGEFLERYQETEQKLGEWHDYFEEEPPSSTIELTAAASVELGLEAMEAVQDDLLGNSTGKHNILWNCEQLLGALADLRSGESMEGPDPSELETDLDRTLNALEVNSAIYGYVDIPSEEELDELFRSAEPSNREDLIA